VADRDEPVVACSEWHGDGTACEDDRGSGLAVMAPARAMGELSAGVRGRAAPGGGSVHDYG
jgi:hypothetical protein